MPEGKRRHEILKHQFLSLNTVTLCESDENINIIGITSEPQESLFPKAHREACSFYLNYDSA